MRPGRCDRIPWGLTRIKTHIGGWCSHDSFGAAAPKIVRSSTPSLMAEPPCPGVDSFSTKV